MSELLTRMKIATMALAALLLAGCGRQAGPPSTVGGTVKDSSGRPAAGALVRVSSAQPGRVVLVVNTASHCGYTSQYGPLEAVWRANRPRGLTVLGVPSKDFQQELPTDALVKRFCKRNFGVTFPMLRISRVTGAKAIPLFKGLAAPSWSSQPEWNFNKYLVDRSGRVAMYFPSSEEPDSPAVTKAIDALLGERRARSAQR